jgi:hypothetical protein
MTDSEIQDKEKIIDKIHSIRIEEFRRLKGFIGNPIMMGGAERLMLLEMPILELEEKLLLLI